MSKFRNTYRLLSPDEKDLMDLIKHKADDLQVALDLCPNTRERALAMTKLEEAVMWAVKGITG